MKNSFKQFWIIVFITVIIFSACGNEPDNFFSINGITYRLYKGEMYYKGPVIPDRSNNIELYLFYEDENDYEEIFLDLYIPDGNNRLVEGTYNLTYNYEPFTCSYGEIQIEKDRRLLFYYRITGGTLQVSVTGSGDDAIYTINIDCNIEDQNGLTETVRGTYRGTIAWFE